MKALVCLVFRGVAALDFVPRLSMSGFELYGCEPAEGGVPAAAVVEDLEVLEHRVHQLEAGAAARWWSKGSTCMLVFAPWCAGRKG